MITTALADRLAQAGLDFTIKEIEDVIWLASRIDAASPANEGAQTAPLEDLSPPDDDEALDPPDAPLDATTCEDGPVDLPPKDAVSPTSISAGGIDGAISGGAIRVRGVAGTVAPDQFRLAMQPFARRVLSRVNSTLDEEATAAHAAETGHWLPHMQPMRERCFDLSLVIEDCTSANLRDQALRELACIYRTYTGLRSVTCYRLHGEQPLRLTALDGGAEYGVDHLLGTDRRHLVLLATDGTSSRWRNGDIQNFLHAVGAVKSVSILHLLPPNVWRRTLTGKADVTLYSTSPGEPNRHYESDMPWWMDGREPSASLFVPLLAMDALDAGRWARGISARSRAAMPGIMVARQSGAVPTTARPPSAAHPAASLVSRYLNIVSDPAYELAVFLCTIDPLTVPVMRLVQRIMLPDTGDGELAEFILGGLIVRVPGDDKPDTEPLYRFHHGVREELIKSLRYSEGTAIVSQLRHIGRQLELNSRDASAFTAYFPQPSGPARLSLWTLPFAEVSRQILNGADPLALPTVLPAEPPPQRVKPSAAENWLGPVFVGRETELVHLHSILTPPSTGDAMPRCLILGPRGVGKTALAMAYVARFWGGQPAFPKSLSISALHPDELEEQLLRNLSQVDVQVRNHPSANEYLSRTNTLLIIDDVEPSSFEVVARIVDALPNSTVLLLGFDQGDDVLALQAQARAWPILTLGGLPIEIAVEVLRGEEASWSLPPGVLTTMADTLMRMPVALRMAGNYLATSTTAYRLIEWLGAEDTQTVPGASTQEDEQHFESLCQTMDGAFRRRWHDIGADVRFKGALQRLVHGPLGGCTPSLAAALTDLPLTDDLGRPTAAFDELMTAAAGHGLLPNPHKLRFAPIFGVWLRRQTPVLKKEVEQALTDWIAEGLYPAGASGGDGWYKLDEAQQALTEWLATCSLEAGTRVLPWFIPFARAHGPLHAWQAFSRRMLMLCPVKAPDHQKWRKAHVQLRDKPTEPSLGWSKPAPRPHQQNLAKVALRATILARARQVPAGIVVQALGTGMTRTLMSYVEACMQAKELRQLSYVIVVDRVDMSKQVVHAYRDWHGPGGGLPLQEPQSVHELYADLKDASARVIVTTAQKLQLIDQQLNNRCIVIYFSLQSPSLGYIRSLGGSTLIVFSQESAMLSKANNEELGKIIASYSRREAMLDGLLRPALLRFNYLPDREAKYREPHSLAAIDALVEFVVADMERRTMHSQVKALLVIDPVDSIPSFMERMAMRRSGRIRLTALGNRQQIQPNWWQIHEFNSAENTEELLVATPRISLGLHLVGLDICYVYARVSAAMQLKIESFINQPAPQGDPGEIVDLAGNDWELLK